MISTLIRVNWLNLKRDRAALVLTFILPIVFFSIFAWIFGSMAGGGGGGPKAVRIIVVDEDDTDVSGRFAEQILDLEAVRGVGARTDDAGAAVPWTRENARAAIIDGDAAAAIVIPDGFADSFPNFGGGGEAVVVIYDEANIIARNMLGGLLQAAAMQAAPDLLMDQGLQQLANFGGGLTPQQEAAVAEIRPFLRGERDWDELEEDEAAEDGAGTMDGATESGAADADDDGGANPFGQGLVRVESEPARQANEDGGGPSPRAQMVSYYAAGIGVMFLLFSMVGAGGSILEEEERGTLERVLSSNVGMWTLLGANWLFFAILGFAQLTVMFVWGWLVFGLPLFDPHHLAGFIVMTAFTAGAAAAFGMLLATLCRTRNQLGGMSTVIILIMSALGGSMVPRVVAPDVFDITSIFTFNGWALDGYLRVFWYAQPDESIGALLVGLIGPLAVLTGMGVVFMLVARRLARRWETV